MNTRQFTFTVYAFFITLMAVYTVQYAHALEIDTSAQQAVMIDVGTRTVLMDKNSQEAMPTSSMSKLMTLAMVFEALQEDRLKLDDEFTVSEKAWRKGGSKMFVEVGNKVRVEDLIRGVAIQSGNDATIVLAEGIAGSESAFADLMNEKAKELGMHNSHFVNASGWPDPDHYSTAYDLALLAYHVIHTYPEYYHFFSETEFTYNNIKQRNRNPLLYRNIGADGIKTGHTEIAGYGLMASAVEGDRRLILVVNGLGSEKERAEEASRLLQWGFRNYDTNTLFKPGEEVDEVRVWLGKTKSVPVTVNAPVKALIERGNPNSLNVIVRLKEPVKAPVSKGDEMGTLIVKAGDFEEKTYPLYATVDIPKLGFVGTMSAKLKHMIGLSD